MRVWILLCAVLTNVVLHPPLTSHAQTVQPTTEARSRAEAQMKLTVSRFEHDKDLSAAREGFEKANALDASYAKPLLYLGQIALRQEDWAEAIKDYEAFCTIDNTSDDYVQAQLKLR